MMFRLPVCPYCKTVYSYKDVKNNKNKNIKCYHCKKNFIRSIKNYVIPCIVVILITIMINVAILTMSKILYEAIIPISIVSIIAVLIILLVLPFFVEYKSDKRK